MQFILADPHNVTCEWDWYNTVVILKDNCSIVKCRFRDWGKSHLRSIKIWALGAIAPHFPMLATALNNLISGIFRKYEYSTLKLFRMQYHDYWLLWQRSFSKLSLVNLVKRQLFRFTLKSKFTYEYVYWFVNKFIRACKISRAVKMACTRILKLE